MPVATSPHWFNAYADQGAVSSNDGLDTLEFSFFSLQSFVSAQNVELVEDDGQQRIRSARPMGAPQFLDLGHVRMKAKAGQSLAESILRHLVIQRVLKEDDISEVSARLRQELPNG